MAKYLKYTCDRCDFFLEPQTQQERADADLAFRTIFSVGEGITCDTMLCPACTGEYKAWEAEERAAWKKRELEWITQGK